MQAVLNHDSNGNPQRLFYYDAFEPSDALRFTTELYLVVIKRWEDANILPFIHVLFTFLYGISQQDRIVEHFESFPWEETAIFLNRVLYNQDTKGDFINSIEPLKAMEYEESMPLPEDFAMSGMPYMVDYVPKKQFNDHKLEEEKYEETASMTILRLQRLFWIAAGIVSTQRFLIWDTQKGLFESATKSSATRVGQITQIIQHNSLELPARPP